MLLPPTPPLLRTGRLATGMPSAAERQAGGHILCGCHPAAHRGQHHGTALHPLTHTSSLQVLPKPLVQCPVCPQGR